MRRPRRPRRPSPRSCPAVAAQRGAQQAGPPRIGGHRGQHRERGRRRFLGGQAGAGQRVDQLRRPPPRPGPRPGLAAHSMRVLPRPRPPPSARGPAASRAARDRPVAVAARVPAPDTPAPTAAATAPAPASAMPGVVRDAARPRPPGRPASTADRSMARRSGAEGVAGVRGRRGRKGPTGAEGAEGAGGGSRVAIPRGAMRMAAPLGAAPGGACFLRRRGQAGRPRRAWSRDRAGRGSRERPCRAPRRPGRSPVRSGSTAPWPATRSLAQQDGLLGVVGDGTRRGRSGGDGVPGPGARLEAVAAERPQRPRDLGRGRASAWACPAHRRWPARTARLARAHGGIHDHEDSTSPAAPRGLRHKSSGARGLTTTMEHWCRYYDNDGALVSFGFLQDVAAVHLA